MAKPLTYPSLKCVLEYLEANKRIHITARSPPLRKIERKIPLHLDSLIFAYSSVTLNNIMFQLYSRIKERGYYRNAPYPFTRSGTRVFLTESILLPGDIPLDSSVDYREAISTIDNRENYPIHLYFGNIPSNIIQVTGYENFWNSAWLSKQHGPSHRVPKHMEFHVAMKHLTSVLLGTRTEILVKRLAIYHIDWQQILRLPLGLKLIIQELEVQTYQLQNLLPLIDCKSLKSLNIMFCHWNDPCFELPIVQSVKKLSITDDGMYHDEDLNDDDSSWNKTLLKLPNREINLDCYSLSEQEMKSFIQGLLNEGRDIGAYYTIINRDLSLWKLDEIGEHFKADKVDGNVEYTYSFSIPMSATTALSIRGSNDQYGTYTEIEVEPITQKEEMNQIVAEKSKDNGMVNFFLLLVFLLIYTGFLLISMFELFKTKLPLV